MPKFGPGTLTIGETGSDIDASCQVNSLRIAASKDEGDSKTMMCGTDKPGKVTYTYAMTGNLDIDSDDPEGLFALTQTNPGAEVPFTFQPNTEFDPVASGTLILDPEDYGGDEYGDDMNSDIEWTIVGKPEYTWATPDPPRADPFAKVVQDGRTPAGGKVTTTLAERLGKVATAKKAQAKAAEKANA